MPTAGRLVAAIMFAALTYYISVLTIPQMEEGTAPKYYAEINAAIGALMGWIVAGSRARAPWLGAVSYGLTAIVAILFWTLLAHAFVAMVKGAMRGSYGASATDAVVDVFRLMMENGMLMLTPLIMGVVVGGAIVAGLITEFFARRFN